MNHVVSIFSIEKKDVDIFLNMFHIQKEDLVEKTTKTQSYQYLQNKLNPQHRMQTLHIISTL